MADKFGLGDLRSLISVKYCCCAIPLVNAGIYAIMTEQLLVGVGLGVGALATPKVLAANFPSFATWIFAVTCFVIAGLQPLGFIGVMREKTTTFRWYSWLNLVALIAAFGTSGALIAVSGVNHNAAVTGCISNYFKPASNASASATSMLQQQAPIICGPFAWAILGLMGGLWLVLVLLQGYFMYLIRSYSGSQVDDHKLYHSVYSENPEAFTMSILQSKRYNPNSVYSSSGPLPRPPTLMRDDAWSARGSMDSQRGGAHPDEVAGLQQDPRRSYYANPAGQEGYGAYGSGSTQDQYAHQRGQSYASAHSDGARYEDADPRRSAYGAQEYPSQHQQGYGYGGYVQHPQEARYGRDPGPTPELNQYSVGQGVGFAGSGQGLNRPEAVQYHPAEGMLGRKSPRGFH